MNIYLQVLEIRMPQISMIQIIEHLWIVYKYNLHINFESLNFDIYVHIFLIRIY